jgi:RpiB/LacA/LacB family sugar-phosphate isomerase
LFGPGALKLYAVSVSRLPIVTPLTSAGYLFGSDRQLRPRDLPFGSTTYIDRSPPLSMVATLHKPNRHQPRGQIVRIGIGSDHSGFAFKERLRIKFSDQGHTVEDVGPRDLVPSDYHNVTDQLASALRSRRVDRGVLICSSAIGASVAANKHPGVRAALCQELYSVQHGVQDDNMNLLVLEARVLTDRLASQLTDAFLNASHIRREPAFGIPPGRLAGIVEFIRSNLDRRVHVSELSELAGMSQWHFSKLFKLSTGLSPHRYMLHERINRSKELLRQGRAKIVDIALEVGFENQAHFTTVFGNLVGMTPRQFQQSMYDEESLNYSASLAVAHVS